MPLQVGTIYRLRLPNGDELVFNDEEDDNFAGIVTDITSNVQTQESNTNIPQADAILIGDTYFGGRTTAMDVMFVEGDVNLRAQTLEKIQSLHRWMRHDLELTWQEATGVHKLIRGRLSNYITPQHQIPGPRKNLQIQLISQPLIVTDKLHILETGRAGNLEVFNIGNADAYPTFYVHGPFSEFLLTNSNTGEQIRVTHTLPNNTQYIEISTAPAKRYVVLNGNIHQSLYGAVDFNAQVFFSFEPGTTGIQFTPTGGTADTYIRIEHRSSWL